MMFSTAKALSFLFCMLSIILDFISYFFAKYLMTTPIESYHYQNMKVSIKHDMVKPQSDLSRALMLADLFSHSCQLEMLTCLRRRNL
jgi:hypothetical protein